MALLTTEDVLNKKFQYVKFREGYDQDEVDEFLDEVVSTIYSLQMENQELKEKLEAAERRVAELSNSEFTPSETPAPVMPAFAVPQDPDSATSMLALAQRVHDEYVRDGEEQSAKIIAEAKAERESIIAEAHKQKDNVLKQLEQERELLENKINGLRTFESEYRSNLRNHLESLLNEVGNNEN